MSGKIVQPSAGLVLHRGTRLLSGQAAQRQVVRRTELPKPVPVQQQIHPFDLETSFLEEPNQHRWLLTTCIAGIAGTVIVGGALLGLFGRNASPPNAVAAVSPFQGQAKLKSPGDPNAAVVSERDLQGGFAYPKITQDELPYGNSQTTVLDADIQSATNSNENITTITKTPPPEPVDETFELSEGSTLAKELTNRGVSNAAAEALISSIEEVFPVQNIKTGTKFEVTFDRQIDFYGREVTFPVEVSFQPTPKQTITVDSDEDGVFTAQLEGNDNPANPQVADKPTITQFHTVSKVGSSLYATAKDRNIPDYIISEFTRIFSYDVDFQRQVSPSDTFEIFYGNPLTGSSSKRKVLHYAKLTIDGETKTLYRYTTADGQTDYFDENGHSAQRALLKTPVSGARLTSGFGMRVHPLLGYSKMHTGVDFGASIGTPIHAAGNGVIELAGRNGGYGNAIVIKHGPRYQTLYGHMSRFAAGIHPGVQVNQGQIIGYVGSTGRSTGPHLHYEVRVDEEPVNPLSVRATGGRQLAGKDLDGFRNNRTKIASLMESAPSSDKVAQGTQ
jgi:murein DD-endopeptidase MepM/ murein hydrolase activator NlpD